MLINRSIKYKNYKCEICLPLYSKSSSRMLYDFRNWVQAVQSDDNLLLLRDIYSLSCWNRSTVVLTGYWCDDEYCRIAKWALYTANVDSFSTSVTSWENLYTESRNYNFLRILFHLSKRSQLSSIWDYLSFVFLYCVQKCNIFLLLMVIIKAKPVR